MPPVIDAANGGQRGGLSRCLPATAGWLAGAQALHPRRSLRTQSARASARGRPSPIIQLLFRRLMSYIPLSKT
jgi:hypothetical protein